MVTYTLQDLFDDDSTMYDLNIELTDGTVYNNQNIMSEEFTLTESTCSQETISFGQCESSSVRFKLLDISKPLKDQYITIKLILNGDTEKPFIFGTYKVFDDTVSDDKEYREVIAYDELYYICQLNVIDWYNSLWTNTESISLKKFRESFFEFIKSKQFNCNVETAQLPNDNLLLKKGVDGDSLTGGTVLKSICEINGCFGHIKRNGNFSYLTLKSDIVKEYDYTQYTEYYPKDYYTDLISRVQIKYSDDSAYAEYGTGDNVYSITGNFLLFGLEESQLKAAAKNIYDTISVITYCPVETFNLINADPCVEVGDYIKVTTTSGSFNTYVLSRTISGIQGMFDRFVAKGTKEIGNRTTTLSEQLKMINGRTRTIKNTVDELSIEFTKLETDISTNYSTTEETKTLISTSAEGIKTEVSKTYTTKDESKEILTSMTKIEQTADKINWIVQSGTSETDFTLTDRTVDLVTESFTITDSTGTQTIIQGGKLQAQSIGASEIRADELSVGKLFTESGGRRVDIHDGCIYLGDNVRIDCGLLNAESDQTQYNNAMNISCLGYGTGQIGLMWADNGQVTLDNNFYTYTDYSDNNKPKIAGCLSLGSPDRPIDRLNLSRGIYFMDINRDQPDYSKQRGGIYPMPSKYEDESGGMRFWGKRGEFDKAVGDYLYYTAVHYDELIKGSDRRLKNDIQEIPEEQIKKLIEDFSAVSFTYKRDENKKLHFGAIAQDVLETLDSIGIKENSSLVQKIKGKEIGEEYYGVSYDEYIPLIIAYCQYLKKCINNLQK